MNEMTAQQLLEKRATEFSKRGIFVHIDLKDGLFLNGTISEVSSDFFIFNDRIKGELPVFFQEIKALEIFRLNKKEENNGRASN